MSSEKSVEDYALDIARRATDLKKRSLFGRKLFTGRALVEVQDEYSYFLHDYNPVIVYELTNTGKTLTRILSSRIIKHINPEKWDKFTKAYQINNSFHSGEKPIDVFTPLGKVHISK